MSLYTQCDGFILVIDRPLLDFVRVKQGIGHGFSSVEGVKVLLRFREAFNPVPPPGNVVSGVLADVPAVYVGGYYRGPVRRFDQGGVQGGGLEELT